MRSSTRPSAFIHLFQLADRLAVLDHIRDHHDVFPALRRVAGDRQRVAEVLVVLALMDVPVSFAEAFVIESLLQAIRGAAFAIPSALGAQEGGLILLCAIFGIPPAEAIGLSLVKRAADLVVGGPSLLGWQMLEWRRLIPQLSATQQQHRGPADGDRRER